MTQSSVPTQASSTRSAPADNILDAISTLLGSFELTSSQAKALVKVIMAPFPEDASSCMNGEASSKVNPSYGSFELTSIPADDFIPDSNSLSIYVTLDSYSAKSPSVIVIEESHEAFAKVADAMADECFLYYYQGMLYNMPAVASPSPPYYCMTCSRYVGVFNGWDNVALKVQGVSCAIFSKVDSLEAGEEKLKKAIE